MFINARFLTQRVTGVQRFAREITGATANMGLLGKPVLLAPRDAALPRDFHGLEVRQTGSRHGHVWEQIDLPRAAADDFLINLCNTAPAFKTQQLVVLHDAAVAANAQNFTLAFRAWYQVLIRSYARRAAKLATVSTFSADEMARCFGIPRGHIEIIPESGEHILRQTPDYSLHDKFGLEQDGYFLAVSSHAPTKNFCGILEAVAQLPPLPFKFVIVGGRDARVFNAGALDAKGAIETGYVSDAQLRALYERAACFVYPSLYEGFGLPPLEAMSCGCPVLTSNTTSLPETCGAAAAYCNPHDSGDIARQLATLLGSRTARDELRAAGLKRAKAWTWARAATRLNDIISG
ncbi:MAG: glycosyltransferase family 1 protein [Alphaproteobacteria bacterium]|nr:glycosyltransferase family 1 protein [Alphaproteobacteria bacterium]